MNEVDYLKILKWVLIVLLAGFIGQFGKSLAKHLMEKARLKKEKLAAGLEIPTVPQANNKQSEKFQKSESEVFLKKPGKEDLSTKMDEDPDLEQVKEDAKMEKKALKALVKQKKKETKLFKKEEEEEEEEEEEG